MATSGRYLNLNEHGSSNLSSTNTALSPTSPQLGFPPTPTSNSAGFEDLGSALSEYGLTTDQNKSVTGVLRSLTGSHRTAHSYELLEEDDYEQITPRQPKDMAAAMAVGATANSGEDLPVRTASISRHLPLHNPTPDLQSLQGAYVKNVQALEDSAERISLAASIEDELQRMKMEMRRSESLGKNSQHASDQYTRRFSAKSNSIIGVNAAARSGGYSPAGVTSPIGSVRSQRRVSQRASRVSRQSMASNLLPEPELEGRPLESAMVHSPPAHVMQPRQSSESQRSVSQGSVYDRPGTSVSNDTYRQAQNLFTDFDGTHFSPPIHDDDSFTERLSLNFPPLARDSRVFSEPQPDQKTVYYPAPVPVMLNLPKRLSKHNWAQQEKRRTVLLSSIPAENRQSAAWLGNAEIDAEIEEQPSRRMSNIPPQLRASAFFDSPSSRSDIQLKHGSAVITLDSILDAAAHAPVSAFTDHPIAGHLGSEVYGQELRHKKKSSESRQKRKSNMSNMLVNRRSTGNLSGGRRLSQTLDNEVELPEDDPERAGERSLAPDADELIDPDERRSGDELEQDEKSSSGESEDEVESQHQLGFLGAPTTLLAELQLRKEQQKLRNRTAANAFSTGMHSTLLELDAVSQLQQRSRKQKHVALAWEDKNVADKENFEDEDTPLGVLFPEKERQNHTNMHRPLGLMEKKELEENETLGSRRARLRGEVYKPSQSAYIPIAEESAPAVRIPGIDNDEDDEEGETLAQRRKRMQEKTNKRASLADEIAVQLGVDPEEMMASEAIPPEPEETLGQRRKRLQAEAQNTRPQLKQKTSMGDLLRANPVGSRNEEEKASAESKIALLMNRRDNNMPLIEHIQAQQPNSKLIPSNPPPYFPKQPLLGHTMQVGHQAPVQQQQQSIQQIPAMYMPQMPSMQSMPNLNMMNPGAGFGAPTNYPYGAQNMNMSNMSLGMMYNPMSMNMGAMQMPMGGYPQAAPAYDAIGMGPPLNPQQRARIDTWRQSVL